MDTFIHWIFHLRSSLVASRSATFRSLTPVELQISSSWKYKNRHKENQISFSMDNYRATTVFRNSS